jgi:hypothetical protein
MNEEGMNLNYRNSLKPHLTSSSVSKSGTTLGGGGFVMEMTHHDGQSLTLFNLPIPSKSIKLIHITKFDNNSIANFQSQLSYEQWDNVFGNDDNKIFNNFLNTYLRCYYSSFKKKKNQQSIR